jgi:hypothetical protein
MMAIHSSVATSIPFPVPVTERNITTYFRNTIVPPSKIVQSLILQGGKVDIICWYEGTQKLPESGASFMTEHIFRPLFERKKDVQITLYSLRAWSFQYPVREMRGSKLVDAINKINQSACKAISSASFFQYCTQVPSKTPLGQFLNKSIQQKPRLFQLSEEKPKKGMTVGQLFEGQPSLLAPLYDLDVSAAYSTIQYIEGYFLVQDAVRRGIAEGRKTIKIAFVLPNDEGKYYTEFPGEVESMLQADFGEELRGLSIDISFDFFSYGTSPSSRPYTDRAREVSPGKVASYFTFIRS